MRVLLDTHSFLWVIAGSDDLSIRARDLIADLGNEVLLSVASLWEIALKVSIGKVELSRPFGEIIPEQLRENEITVLPIALSHLAVMIELPFRHRDPFDRLIIAQGVVEGLPVISRDPVFPAIRLRLFGEPGYSAITQVKKHLQGRRFGVLLCPGINCVF